MLKAEGGTIRTIKFVLLAALLFTSDMVFSEISNRYWLNKKDLKGVFKTDWDSLKLKGKLSHKQPFFNTQILQHGNTDYLILQISTNVHSESVLLNKMLSSGKFKLLQRREVNVIYDARIGGNRTISKYGKITAPSNLNRIWIVEKTTD